MSEDDLLLAFEGSLKSICLKPGITPAGKWLTGRGEGDQEVPRLLLLEALLISSEAPRPLGHLAMAFQ